jgi:hypothetical protein
MSPAPRMACMMLPRCARTCGGAWLFSCCWRLERAARRPSPVRTAAVDRAPAEQAEQPETAGAGAEAQARRDPRADRAEVAAREAARRIKSGALAARRAPAPVIPAAAPASRVLRRTAEPARPDRPARPAPEVLAGAAAPPARVVLAAPLAPAVAAATVVDRVGRADQRCAARARARAVSSACTRAAAARLRGAIHFPMVANVRRDGPIRLSATLLRRQGRAARSRRARLPLPSASRGPRRAAPP